MSPPAVGALAASLVWVSFSYSGWNAAVYIASEVVSPGRNLARSLVWGTLAVTAVYLAFNAVIVYSGPASELAGQVAVAKIAAQSIGGPGLAVLVTAVVLLALTTSVSAMIMAGPRVYARMAGDGVLPGWLRSESGPPRTGIGLQLALALVFLWTGTFEQLLGYIGFTLSLSTGMTVVGLIRLKRRDPSVYVPGWPFVPGFFLMFVLWSLVFSVGRLGWSAGWGLGTLALGGVMWSFQSRQNQGRTHA